MSSLNRKFSVIPILWFVCAIEALAASAYLLHLPADPKSIAFAGYSWIRLIMVAGLVGASLVSAWFSYTLFRQRGGNNPFLSIARLEIARGWSFFVAVVTVLVCAFLLVITPPSLRGARIERLAPVLIWLGLCGLQIAITLLFYGKSEILSLSRRIVESITHANENQYAGLGLLLLSLVIGLITIFYTYYNYGDEGDTYTVGWLISKGFILYKDVFSHHFPFSYLWIGVITKIFGPSILAYRVSLLLLRIGLLVVSLRLSGNAMVIGLTSIAWSIIGPLYLSNLLLYYSFDCIFIVCSLFVVLAVLNNDRQPSWKIAVFVGSLAALASLTDPAMVLPGGVIVSFLAASGLLKSSERREKVKNLFLPFLSIGIVILCFGIYLIVTSSFNDFIQNAILFNVQVYSKYTSQSYSLSGVLIAISRALNVFDPTVRQNYSPYYRWEYFTELEHWAFSALFFRLSIIFTSLVMLFRKKFSSGLLFYITGALIFSRGIPYFRGMPFVLLAIAGASYSVVQIIDISYFFLKQGRSASIMSNAANLGSLFLAVITSLMFCVLLFQTTGFWLSQRSRLSYSTQFGQIITDSSGLRNFACGYSDATLLVYPLNPGSYFFSKLSPASPYLFMTPWVAEVAQQKVITQLNGQAAVVYIDKDTNVWGIPVKEYLRDLISYLDSEYIEVEKNIYVAPILDQYCKSKK